MKNILFIILALLLLSSCKKEIQIKKNLWNHDGKWDIVKYEEIVTSTWSANEKNKIVQNYGIFQFNKNGTGWIIESDDFEAYKDDFKYSNTATELSIVYDDGGSTDTYDLDWEKNSYTLTQSGTNTYNVYSPNPNGDSLTITDHRLYRMTCEKE